MAKRRRSDAESRTRQAVAALVAAAGQGRADLGWLDAAIREAGYVRKGERMTKDEVARERADAAAAMVAVLEEVAAACGATCGTHIVSRIQEGVARIAQTPAAEAVAAAAPGRGRTGRKGAKA